MDDKPVVQSQLSLFGGGVLTRIEGDFSTSRTVIRRIS